MAKQSFGGKKGTKGVSGAPPFAKKSGGNPFAKKGGNPFADSDNDGMKKGGRVKKANGGAVNRAAPNGNTWKHNDSPSKPFAATDGMKKGGRVC